MKPKPIHRSLTFWTGLLVLVFIVWAWRDSARYRSSVDVRLMRIGNTEGGLLVEQEGEYSSMLVFDRRKFTAQDRGGQALLPPLRYARGLNFDKRSREYPGSPLKKLANLDSRFRFRLAEDWALFLPHWLLLLAVALPWSGVLFWRAMRIRSVAARTTEPTAD